jgi:sterol desaturase/sphingolipid hydroxylase (fatty acid hydroxylase superfamily)
MVVEYFTARHLYHVKESASSLTIALVAAFIASFTKVWAFGVFILVFEATKELRLEFLGYTSFGWAWYVWVIAVVMDDFNFYWHHRLCHNVRVLWAFHVPHHNAKTFNLSVSLRNGWFITLYKPMYWMWMPLIGFEPVMVAAALLINGAYQLFLHSQLVPSYGRFEKVLNSPWLHQVHHSSNIEYLDKNHAGIFAFWDRLFGTFQAPIPEVTPKFGVLKGPESLNPINANLHEFVSIWKDVRKARSWSDKLKYIFGPPGWSHDKSTLTAKEMQAALVGN